MNFCKLLMQKKKTHLEIKGMVTNKIFWLLIQTTCHSMIFCRCNLARLCFLGVTGTAKLLLNLH